MDSNPTELQIEALNSSGQGIGTEEGLKVFVDFALPGEKVLAKIKSRKKNYALADLVEIQEKSLDRVDPICPVFYECGGCQIMHWSEKAQLDYKTQKVLETLKRVGHFKDPLVLPCLASPKGLYYRNKIQMPFFEKDKALQLGLYQKHSNEVVEVQKCFIHCELGQKVMRTLLKLLKKTTLTAYDSKTQKGFLRHLLIRTGVKTQECLVALITSNKKHFSTLSKLAKELMEQHPEIKGVVQNVNKKRYNSILGDQLITLSGRPYLFEEMNGLRLKLSVHAFFQVNPFQASYLYETALRFAALEKTDVLLDAYCGIGLFALLAAPQVQTAFGIESVAAAIADAKENAKLNHINHVKFQCARVEDFLEELPYVNVVILNPPRKGAEKKVLEAFCKRKIPKIVYVSCDPATLSRDLDYLCTHGYELIQVQPLDLFPQTTHVESIALLKFQEKRPS